MYQISWYWIKAFFRRFSCKKTHGKMTHPFYRRLSCLKRHKKATHHDVCIILEIIILHCKAWKLCGFFVVLSVLRICIYFNTELPYSSFASFFEVFLDTCQEFFLFLNLPKRSQIKFFRKSPWAFCLCQFWLT